MSEIPIIIQQLREPITENTRKTRRELLVASTIGIIIVYSGLIPTKIAALGITLTAANQASFRYVIAGIVLYLTLAFLIYVSSEIVAWGSLFRRLDLEKIDERLLEAANAVDEAEKRLKETSEETEEVDSAKPIDWKELSNRIAEASQFKEAIGALADLRHKQPWLVRVLSSRDSLLLLRPMRTLRIIFEAAIPLILSVFSMLSLVLNCCD